MTEIKQKVLDTLFSLAIALLLALSFRCLAFEPYKIPSGSMFPNLLVGDYIFVSKYSYGYSNYSFFGLPLIEDRIWWKEPERGDIIVFKHTRKKMTYIKRLIALPGEEVQIISGVIHINGVAVPRIAAGEWESDVEGNMGQYKVYEEQLPNGAHYKTLEMIKRPLQIRSLRNTGKYKVPAGHYFFMGDNRDNSIDSRFDELGFVPRKNLIGKAKMLYWSGDISIMDLFTKFEYGRTFSML
ncbi:MAG: signal peptidase I [Proteobacteria bacterium]|nr:signal peptidase I [Pseudomonadota bacterium]